MDSLKNPLSWRQVGGIHGTVGEAHPTVEITHLPRLTGKTKLPKKRRDCQEKGMQ
jgi:hypothetical protein